MKGGPLCGKRVLLTRPAGRGSGLAKILRDWGAHVEEHPAIAFESLVDSAAVRAAVRDLATFGALLFTSPTGVQYFRAALAAHAPDATVELPPSAAVGPGTARVLREAGISAALIADGGGEGLARAVRELGLRERPVLIVRPEGALDSVAGRLREAGIGARAVAFYRTMASPSAAVAARRLVEVKVDAVVFASPSALRALLDSTAAPERSALEALRATARIAIGPITAAALRAEGLEAHAVAVAPTDAAVSRAVLSVLRA